MQDYVNDHGYIAVGDGHELYFEDWGNPNGEPIISLHGGPGAMFTDSHKAIFDPLKHRVIFYDQRGCGRSKPFASTTHNTTQDLVDDIEKIRKKFGFETMHVAGGSWGSALALFYAIAYPAHVKSLLIWSVFLAEQFDTNWVNEGYSRYHFPAEWARFISHVPKTRRMSGDSIMHYYAAQMRSNDTKRATLFALEWALWEATLMSISYDPIETENEVRTDPDTLSLALLETHYFLHHCFVPKNYIRKNLDKITHIRCTIIQGRFDMCTPPVNAYELAKVYGENAHLAFVNSGHRRSDPEMMAALQESALVQLV